MAVATAIAGASLALGVGSAIQANKRNRQSAAASREVAAIQQKQSKLQEARMKRDAVRSARLAYGQAQQNAANQGASMSSASMGGLSSIASQLSDNISFLDQYGFYSDQASQKLGEAGQLASSAQSWGALSGLGFNIFNNAQGITNTFFGSSNSG